MSTQYFRFSARNAGGAARCELLEQLLARADTSTAVVDWRADAYGALEPRDPAVPGLAAVALLATDPGAGTGADTGAGHATGKYTAAAEQPGTEKSWVYFATPVHYVAEMSNVRMAAAGILALSEAEAAMLAADFNRVWNDAGVRMVTGSRAQLSCVFERPLPAVTRDPEEALNQRIENYLPGGAGASRLRRLMSEMEMWLFGHEVNKTRAADGAPPITGLWLWGGGAALTSMPAVRGWTYGTDPFFAALAGGAAEAAAMSGVIVLADCPGTAAWNDMQSRCLAPALAQLRSGRLARVVLSAADRSFSLGARWRWRFWRRVRPWWESFA